MRCESDTSSPSFLFLVASFRRKTWGGEHTFFSIFSIHFRRRKGISEGEREGKRKKFVSRKPTIPILHYAGRRTGSPFLEALQKGGMRKGKKRREEVFFHPLHPLFISNHFVLVLQRRRGGKGKGSMKGGKKRGEGRTDSLSSCGSSLEKRTYRKKKRKKRKELKC